MALAVGNHADVAIRNCLIVALSPDGSYAQLQLPYDGTSVDGDGNKVFVNVWLPANDPRVTITQVAPANWPPQENDLWIVPSVTPPAFVVSDGAGHLFFVTAATIRKAYASQGKPALPPTTNDALVQYGNQLLLLHRGVT